MAEDTAAKTSNLLALIERKRQEEQERELQRQKRPREDAVLDEEDIDVNIKRADKDNEDDVIDFGGDSEEEEQDQVPTEDAVSKRGFDDEGEGDLEIRDEDKAFIDDEGLAQDERVDFADDAAATFDEAEEALEDDELSTLFNKGRNDIGGEAEIARQAENLMAQMEAALDSDHEAFVNKTPALHKLRMLKKAKDAFGIQRMHEYLMRGGILGILKGWLEPMPDGTLPNSKVRAGVLEMLISLNINSANEDHRDQLKKSGVGKLVMLLSKLPEETPGNQRLARALVESWSRPILGTGTTVDRLQRDSQSKPMSQKQPRSLASEDNEDTGNPHLRHAVIPKAAELDYVVRPKSKVDVSVMNTHKSTKEPKLLKKLRANTKK
jgi:transcription factor SPN1